MAFTIIGRDIKRNIVVKSSTLKYDSIAGANMNKIKYMMRLKKKLNTKTVEQSVLVKFFSLIILPPIPESASVVPTPINIARIPTLPKSSGEIKFASIIVVTKVKVKVMKRCANPHI